jgi:hypothetical protein
MNTKVLWIAAEMSITLMLIYSYQSTISQKQPKQDKPALSEAAQTVSST